MKFKKSLIISIILLAFLLITDAKISAFKTSTSSSKVMPGTTTSQKSNTKSLVAVRQDDDDDDFDDDDFDDDFGFDDEDEDDDDTETTSNSWGDNLANSVAAAVIGVIIFFAGFPVLWFNERRYIKENDILISGQKICAQADQNLVDPNNDDELVYLSGTVTTNEELSDPTFALKVTNSLKLKRIVEVYQMKERVEEHKTQDTFGDGSTTTKKYFYEKHWVDEQIDSQKFHKHREREANTKVKFLAQNQSFQVENVNVGQFKLSNDQITKLQKFKDYKINKEFVNFLPPDLLLKIDELGWPTVEKRVENEKYLIISQNSECSNIGDIRISYQVIEQGPVTIVAQQSNGSFVPYDIKKKRFRRIANKTRADGEKAQLIDADERGWTCDQCDIVLENICCCCCCCKCIEDGIKEDDYIDWFFEESHTKEGVFELQVNKNESDLNVYRAIGWLCLCFGIWLFFQPLATLFSFISFLGSLISLIAAIIGLIIGSVLAGMVIALSWIVHRPIIGISTLILGSGIIAFTIYYTHYYHHHHKNS